MAYAQEKLSDAEAAYFNSGGTDEAGLLSELGIAGGSQPSPAAPETQSQMTLQEDPDVAGDQHVTRDEKGQYKTVSYNAFHSEREKRKAAKAEADQFKKQYDELFARAKVYDEILGKDISAEKPQEQLPARTNELPDPERDLFGFMRGLAERQVKFESDFTSNKQQAEARENEQSMKTAYAHDAKAFIDKNPDFMDAYKHLLNSRAAELRLTGMTDEAEIQRSVMQDERAIVASAFKQKKSPSEVLYAFAKGRGYAPKAALPTPATDGLSPADKIANIKKGQANMGSLSSAGGGPTDILTSAKFANMPEKEFAKHFSKMSAEDQRRYLGG